MLTKLESLLDKALRGIDLAELPIIVVVITRLLALPMQLLARYQVTMADCVGQDVERRWIVARYYLDIVLIRLSCIDWPVY